MVDFNRLPAEAQLVSGVLLGIHPRCARSHGLQIRRYYIHHIQEALANDFFQFESPNSATNVRSTSDPFLLFMLFIAAISGSGSASNSQIASFQYSTEKRGYFLQEDPMSNSRPPRYVGSPSKSTSSH